MFKHGSLFSGIGGFDLASEWMGWENVFQVEWDLFCQKVLAKNFPNVKRYGDIKEFDGTKYSGLIDILTGGFPCQPFSVAGKQKGKRDDRHLWPEMFRIVREIQPSWIVGENVPGIIRMELENICVALESEGYEVQPFIIPSASIGAWDKRDRIWIIAYNHKFRCKNEQKRSVEIIQDEIRINEIEKQGRREQQCGIMQSDFVNTDTNSKGLQKQFLRQLRSVPETDGKFKRGANNGIFSTSKQWEKGWLEVATQLCGNNARVLHRMDRIKALGNSVNPYVPFQIFKAIEQYEFVSNQNKE